MTTTQEPASVHVSHGPITRAVVAVVMASSRFSYVVILVGLALTAFCGWYAIEKLEINTNTDDFISAKVPWRQDEIAYNKAFPDQDNQIIVVVDGITPERTQEAVNALDARLQGHPDLLNRWSSRTAARSSPRTGCCFRIPIRSRRR